MLRRSPRAIGLWVGAAALACTTGAVVAGDLTALHRRAHSLGPEEGVVVARVALPLGATVTPADVRVRRVHRSQLPPGVLHSVAAAAGRVVQVPVVRDGFVHAAHLAPRSRRGLAGALPEGTRLVEVPLEAGLRPDVGSAVDVYTTDAADPLGTGRSAGAATLAVAGAIVVATDPESVTLLVDDDDVASLAAAVARGTPFLALVPPEDARVPGAVTPR